MSLRGEARWLGAGFAVSLASTFGQTAFVSVFAADLMARHGLSQGGWAAIYAAGTTLSAVIMVWAGGLADRVPLGRLTGWTLAGLALACLGMAAAPGAWALVPLVLALRLFGQGMLSHVAMVAMARWYVARRGMALAVAALGFAVGQAVLPLIYTLALERAPAATLWTASAAVAALATLPLARLMRRDRAPRGAEAATEAAGLGGRHWTRAEVLRTPLFWILLPALLGPPSFGTAFFFFQTHLPAAKGWSQPGFVALFPLVMAVSVASTFAAGALIDRVGATRLVGPTLLPMAAGFAGLAWAPTLGWAVPAVVLLAVTMGAMNAAPVAMWAELFGTRHIGAVKASAVAAMVLGTALGPWIVGVGVDAGRPFPAQMPWIALYVAATAAVAWGALRRPARWV